MIKNIYKQITILKLHEEYQVNFFFAYKRKIKTQPNW